MQQLFWIFLAGISEKSLGNLVRKLKAPIRELGEETLKANCDLIKNVATLIDQPTIAVATDTCYNNPSKGQFYSLNGTQCTTPMCELLTEKKLTLALNSLSQICTCPSRKLSEPCHCAANVEPGRPISCQEGGAARENVLKIEGHGLVIGEVVCDGTHQVMSLLKDKTTKKQECNVHRNRGV